jgi:outer membrane protein assembly factor BamD (BamD/ComL family)
LVALLAATSGCSGTGGYLSAWRKGLDSSLSKAPTKEEAGDDRSLMARWLTPKNPTTSQATKPRSTLVLGSDGWKPMEAPPNPVATGDYEAAQKLFQQGKLEEAETAFKNVAKKHKGTPWGEKAQFYLAESQYQRGKLVAAHDSFELLVHDYPGTDYLDKLVSREYTIGSKWLAQYDPTAKPAEKLPWTARFDGRRPLIDTNGHATAALEHVRHHDPTGPLADDAVLKIADFYMSVGNYEDAAQQYHQLAVEHPKSPFVQRAQLAQIDALMKAYMGPEYDGGGLEEARKVIHQTMAMFPDRAVGNEKLYHTLDLINDAQAEKYYNIGDYYRRTGKTESAEYYFGKVRATWPKSPWAVKAKTELASLAKAPRKEWLPSKIMTLPGSVDPFNSTGQMNGMGGMGGMGMGGMGGMGMGGMGGMGMM